MEYMEKVQAALLGGRTISSPPEIVVPFTPVTPQPTHGDRVGTIGGAIAAAMLRSASQDPPDKTAMAIVGAIVAGQYDDEFRAVAPRSHVVTKNALLAMISEPGVSVRGVRGPPPGGSGGDALDERKIAALSGLASILDAEFSVMCDTGEVCLRPSCPSRSFGGRAAQRWDIDLRGTLARSMPP